MNWDKTRTIVLKRDEYTCTYCGWKPPKKLHNKLHIHHVVPWIKCRHNEIDNLIVLCIYCHTLYTALNENDKLNEFHSRIRRAWMTW